MIVPVENLKANESAKKYAVVRGVLDSQTCKLIKNTMIIMKEGQYYLNKVSPFDLNRFADKQPVESNCFGVYGVTANEALLLTVQPIVEKVWGREMYPTYSFARIYWRGATMAKHVDRPACEYSVSACIDVEGGEPWPIWVDGNELVLNPGDLVTYKGLEAEHWREACECRQQIQVFLHYVAKDGPHADQKFDRRALLGLKTPR